MWSRTSFLIFENLVQAGPRREEPSTIVLLGHLKSGRLAGLSALCVPVEASVTSPPTETSVYSWLASVREIDTDSSDRQRENAVVCFLIPKMLFRVKNLKCHRVIPPLKKK